MCQVRLLLPSSDRDRLEWLRPAVAPTGPDIAAINLIDAAGAIPGACVRIGTRGPAARAGATIETALESGNAALCWDDGQFLVLKPRDSVTQAWIWCERLLTELRSADGQDRPTIGLAAASPNDSPEDLLDRAHRAHDRAVSRADGRVHTWEMVELDAAASRIGALPGLTPQSRRQRLFTLVSRSLGPTQREHLTSHSDQVGALAARLAGWLGQDPREVERARLAGLLHDIGKAAIPEDLLAKPSSLSAVERAVIDRHANEGAAVCAHLGLDDELCQSVSHHHTRFDAASADRQEWGEWGGHDVPLPALIVGVADALVAMTTNRPYREGCSTPAALDELKRHRAKQFDPVVVDAAVSMLSGAQRIAA